MYTPQLLLALYIQHLSIFSKMKNTSTLLLLLSLFLSISILVVQGQTCKSYAFSSSSSSNNNVSSFTSCNDLPVLSSYLHWTTYDESTNTVQIAYRRTGVTTSSWVSWAINPSGTGMIGSQALVAFRNSTTSSMVVYTSPITAYSTSLLKGDLSFNVSHLSATYSESNGDGEIVIFATLQFDTATTSVNQVWNNGLMSSGGVPQMHSTSGDNVNSKATLDFLSGQQTGSASSVPRQKRKNVHGVLNAVSWGTLMPLGAMIARYMKVFKSADPAWFYLHVACQSSAYIIGVSGWATGLKLGSDSSGFTYHRHRNIGIALFAIGTLQVFALLLRPRPDHKFRRYWNVYHHSVGYAVIVLSIINIYEGLDILDPEKKWKRIYTGVILSLGCIAAALEVFTWIIVIMKRKKNDGK